MTYDELSRIGYFETLADAFDTDAKTRELLDLVEFPRRQRRSFSAYTPIHYWQYVGQELHNGLVVDGLDRLLKAAAELFPGNKLFRDLAVGSGEDKPSVPAIRVVFIASNPIKSRRLQWDQEASKILKISQDSESLPRRIEVKLYPAVQPGELRAILKREQPDVVHFAGHGDPDGGIVMDDGQGSKHVMSFQALGELFELLRRDGIQIRCVVLNGCSTSEASQQIVNRGVEVVIGSTGEIADEAAIAFTVGFYGSLTESNRVSMGQAIDVGKYEMRICKKPGGSGRGAEIAHFFNPGLIEATPAPGVNLGELYL